MKERILKEITSKVGDEGNHMEPLNNHVTAIAKAQLAWLLLLANNVVEDLKVPVAPSRVTNKERIVMARRKRDRS